MNVCQFQASIVIGAHFVLLIGHQPAFAQSDQLVSLTVRLQDAAMTSEQVGKPTSPFGAKYTEANVSVLKVHKTTGDAQRPRVIEYSADQIVVVGMTADGTEKSRAVMLDPRLIRAESFIADDDWESSVIYRRSVDFSVTLPDEPAIATISVLKPRWTGSEWLFDILAETAILSAPD